MDAFVEEPHAEEGQQAAEEEEQQVAAEEEQQAAAEEEQQVAPEEFELLCWYAIQHNDAESLRMALDSFNGSINIDDTFRGQYYTALHLACILKSASCVQLLLDKGASLEVADIVGRSPFYFACRVGALDVVKLFTASVGDSFEKLFRINGQTSVLINGPMRINVLVPIPQPLDAAADGGHVDVVNFLLEMGAPPTNTYTFHMYNKAPLYLGNLQLAKKKGHRMILRAAEVREFSQDLDV